MFELSGIMGNVACIKCLNYREVQLSNFDCSYINNISFI